MDYSFAISQLNCICSRSLLSLMWFIINIRLTKLAAEHSVLDFNFPSVQKQDCWVWKWATVSTTTQ